MSDKIDTALNSDQNKTENTDPPLSTKEEISDYAKTILLAILLALVVRTFGLEPFNIPSGSMKPTLQIGDYLFVSKPSYGYSRYSFPFGLAPIEGRVWTRDKEPKRGDVIVFKLPANTSIDYIKRVVALPGETVQVRQGRLYINGNIVEREMTGLREVEENGRVVVMSEYIETLPGGLKHYIYEESDDRPLDNTQVFTVPEGHYFLMGDNRDNSQDSRVSKLVGFVPLENVVGKAVLIFFSTNGYANIAELWKWPKSIRYERLFKKIELLPEGQE